MVNPLVNAGILVANTRYIAEHYKRNGTFPNLYREIKLQKNFPDLNVAPISSLVMNEKLDPIVLDKGAMAENYKIIGIEKHDAILGNSNFTDLNINSLQNSGNRTLTNIAKLQDKLLEMKIMNEDDILVLINCMTDHRYIKENINRKGPNKKEGRIEVTKEFYNKIWQKRHIEITKGQNGTSCETDIENFLQPPQSNNQINGYNDFEQNVIDILGDSF